MFNSFSSCFQKVLSRGILELVESKSASNFVSRDELSKRKPPSKNKGCHGDSFSITQPLLEVEDHEKDIKSSITVLDGKASATIRVKVKMTKQEAARLLSRCRDGGILEFRDVARELVDLPMDRVSVVSPCPGSNAVLHSIPEEY